MNVWRGRIQEYVLGVCDSYALYYEVVRAKAISDNIYLTLNFTLEDGNTFTVYFKFTAVEGFYPEDEGYDFTFEECLKDDVSMLLKKLY